MAALQRRSRLRRACPSANQRRILYRRCGQQPTFYHPILVHRNRHHHKGLVDELASPTMFNLYDEIIKSPENAWDFAKRGGQGVIDKVGASSFFKHITGAGRAFEQKILRDVFNPSSAAYKKLQKVVPDLADRKIISNVKICLNPKAVTCTEKGSYFIVDQVLVKCGIDEFDEEIITDMVVAEVKLSAKTATTTGQTAAAKSVGSKLTLRASTRTSDAKKIKMDLPVNT